MRRNPYRCEKKYFRIGFMSEGFSCASCVCPVNHIDTRVKFALSGTGPDAKNSSLHLSVPSVPSWGVGADAAFVCQESNPSMCARLFVRFRSILFDDSPSDQGKTFSTRGPKEVHSFQLPSTKVRHVCVFVYIFESGMDSKTRARSMSALVLFLSMHIRQGICISPEITCLPRVETQSYRTPDVCLRRGVGIFNKTK